MTMHRVFSAALGLLIAASVIDGAAQQPAKLGPRSVSADLSRSRSAQGLLPGTTANVVTTIQGNALNSTNGALPNSGIRLRDARFGRVVDATITDRSGLFSFKTVDPGSYIVEVMSTDQATVLAASQIINVNSGDAVTAVVKLPFRIPPFAGVLGNTAPSAAAVTTEAAASGVLATTVSGQPTSDRPIS